MTGSTRERTDPIGDALAQLRGIGLLVDRLELGPPPGRRVHRVDVEGQRRGKKAGWHIAYEIRLDSGSTMIVGSYGNWIGDQNIKYSLRTRGVGPPPAKVRQPAMTLPELIIELGDEAAAALFGVKVRTVASWRRRERVPRPKQAWAILEKAAGRVDYVGIFGQPSPASDATFDAAGTG